MTTTQAPTLTVDDIFTELETLSNESVRERNARNGAGGNQFGVKLGDIRNVAKPIKTEAQRWPSTSGRPTPSTPGCRDPHHEAQSADGRPMTHR